MNNLNNKNIKSENQNNEHSDEFILNKNIYEENKQIEADKHILNLMYRRYDDETARNHHIDTKNMSLFSFTGIVFTLQSTIFIEGCTPLLKTFGIAHQLAISIIFFASSLSYSLSIYYFLNSIKYKGFQVSPDHNELVDYWEYAYSFDEINTKIIKTMAITLDENDEVLEEKIHDSEVGQKFLILGVFILLIIITYFLLLIIY